MTRRDGGAFRFRRPATRQARWSRCNPNGARSPRATGDYHDLSRVPRHAYVAFYLWLRAQGVHALVHMGAHGTLEWLPGKAVALSGPAGPRR
jgi:cobaltochelatase CobN